MDLRQQWLNAVPWDSVLTVNKALCQAQKHEPLTNAKGMDAAQRLWEEAAARTLSLEQVLDVCRQCYEKGPFAINNGNTFAAVGRTVIEDWLKAFSPVEAQIVRTTVGHYIVGLIGRRELLQVLDHFKARAMPPSTPPAPKPSAPQPLSPPLLTQARPQT
jgi:hypothetical protein